jgi:putative transposase
MRAIESRGGRARNGVSERAICTRKAPLLWIRRFATLDEVRQALAARAAQDSTSCIRQRRRDRTPDHIRADQKALATEAGTGPKMAA